MHAGCTLLTTQGGSDEGTKIIDGPWGAYGLLKPGVAVINLFQSTILLRHRQGKPTVEHSRPLSGEGNVVTK